MGRRARSHVHGAALSSLGTQRQRGEEKVPTMPISSGLHRDGLHLCDMSARSL